MEVRVLSRHRVRMTEPAARRVFSFLNRRIAQARRTPVAAVTTTTPTGSHALSARCAIVRVRVRVRSRRAWGRREFHRARYVEVSAPSPGAFNSASSTPSYSARPRTSWHLASTRQTSGRVPACAGESETRCNDGGRDNRICAAQPDNACVVGEIKTAFQRERTVHRVVEWRQRRWLLREQRVGQG